MSFQQTTRRQVLRSIGLSAGALMFSGVLAACASSTTDGPASASDDLVTCAAPPYLKSHGQPRSPTDLVKQRHECLLLTDPATGLPYEWDFVRGRRRLSAAAGSTGAPRRAPPADRPVTP